MIVGVVADTHGTLPPTAAAVLAGVERIIHAGDIGPQWVLDHLEAIAPVTAVRGNMDSGDLEWRLPERAVLRLGGHRILIGHVKEHLLAADLPEGVDIVITGHTHRARIERVGDVLFVNPGSAGGRGRDGAGPSVAIIDLAAGPPTARIVEL